MNIIDWNIIACIIYYLILMWNFFYTLLKKDNPGRFLSIFLIGVFIAGLTCWMFGRVIDQELQENIKNEYRNPSRVMVVNAGIKSDLHVDEHWSHNKYHQIAHYTMQINVYIPEEKNHYFIDLSDSESNRDQLSMQGTKLPEKTIIEYFKQNEMTGVLFPWVDFAKQERCLLRIMDESKNVLIEFSNIDENGRIKCKYPIKQTVMHPPSKDHPLAL